jgi:tetratricopeptide (TPR) repeat protein
MPTPISTLAVLTTVLVPQGGGGGPAPRNSASSSRGEQAVIIERLYQTVRFEKDGTGRRDLRLRVRVLTEGGVEEFGQLSWGYNSAFEKIKVDSVVVHTVGGPVVVDSTAEQDLTAPVEREAPMYTDFRTRVVTVPALRPGDTLDVHVIWTTVTPVAQDQFWFQGELVKTAVVMDERYELDVPATKYANVKSAAGLVPEITEQGGRKIYHWKHQNLEIPSDSALRAMRTDKKDPDIQVTTFRSWEEIGKWYASLAKDREVPNELMRSTAARLVTGRRTLRDSLSAIYDFVAHDYRYVSLSFGVGRYQPHTAAEIFNNKYGDCKDKHTLLAAMLAAVGLHADPVLISATQDADPDFPTPARFDHLISAVPNRGGDILWLDTTPGLSPFGFLTINTRNKHALVIPQGGAPRMVLTPVAPSVPQRVVFDLNGELNGLGTLKAGIRHEFRGDIELLFRMGFRTAPQARWREMVTQMSRIYGVSGDVSDVKAAAPEETEQPFSFSYQVSKPAFVRWSGKTAETELPLPPSDMPDSIGKDSATMRTFGDREVVSRLKLVIPHGTTARLPISVNLKRSYGTYTASYRQVSDTIVAERLLSVSGSGSVEANARDYASFVRAVKNDEEQDLVLERASGTVADAEANASAVELYRSAIAAYNNRDLPGAIRLLGRVVKLEPRHQQAWNELGRAYLLMGRYDSAATVLKQQVEIDPYHPYAWNNLGNALRALQKYDDAIAAFQKAISINPLDEYAHGNLGHLLASLHRDSAAAAELAQAVSIRPKDPGLLVDLGKEDLLLGQKDSAAANFDRAVELAPSPPIWNNIAYVYAQVGVNFEAAERYARMAVDATSATLRSVSIDHLTPRDWDSVSSIANFWDTLGWIYFGKRDLAHAEPYVRASWQLSHHGEVGDHLAQIELLRGDKATGMKTLAQAAAADGATPDSRTRLAKLAGDGAVDRLVEQGRKDLQDMRTIKVRGDKRDAQGQVNLVLGRSGKVEEVKAGNDSLSPAVLQSIKAAKFSQVFPDSASIRIPRQAVVVCDGAKSECSLTLENADRVRP